MGSIRTFIAIAMPDEALREMLRLQELVARDISGGVRWVSPETMHLTVKFLGTTDETLVPGIAGALQECVRDVPPVRFALTGLGAFPNARNPKVLWAGFVDNGVMPAVHREIEAACEKLGCSRDSRPFAPHLTLGRVRDFRIRKMLAHALQHYGGRHFGAFTATRIALYQSELLPDGARHVVLHECILSPDGGTSGRGRRTR
jgi:RNA 2',3'-cyclic 3'-phosphodiesterase